MLLAGFCMFSLLFCFFVSVKKVKQFSLSNSGGFNTKLWLWISSFHLFRTPGSFSVARMGPEIPPKCLNAAKENIIVINFTMQQTSGNVFFPGMNRKVRFVFVFRKHQKSNLKMLEFFESRSNSNKNPGMQKGILTWPMANLLNFWGLHI